MKLKEIYRTSTFAWSPYASLPLLATGTVAGALDESFSNESQLEIWAPDFLDQNEHDLGGEGLHGPKGYVTDNARFNRLAWGHVDTAHPQGVIAAGLENGELALWDAGRILAGAGASSLISRNTTHTGPVRGLDFNPIQSNLLASGGVASEVYIWDLRNPGTPYTPTPGSKSTKLDEITSLAWNQQVQHVLAGASSTGYTVVWDLRGKREVVALAYGGGAGTLAGQGAAGAGMAVGGRRGMSDIAWHPDNATRLVTASEDDSSPIIMVWDLRNARAPEKILTGHEKGVLSLSWCKQDADLLLSCGKDNRALCWNPQTSEVIGQLPSADNWAFQVDWCPRNPDMFAAAFFDGTIGIHSIQSTNEPAQDARPAAHTDGADLFDTPGFTGSSQSGTLSLKQPPKWLRTPVAASWGFGGKLVTVSNLTSAQGKPQSHVVHVRKVVTETDLIERAKKLQAAIDEDILQTFAQERSESASSTTGEEGWKALLSLFQADSRDQLVTLLGFSKSEIAARVAEAVESLKVSTESKFSPDNDDTIPVRTQGSVVSFAEPESEQVTSETSDTEEDEATTPGDSEEKTPSELSAGVTSDSIQAADADSQTTVPSLFGDDAPGTPHIDFFNTVGVAQDDGETHAVHVPHTNYGLDSSVAATIGSGPSSVASEPTKNGFRIYPSDESDIDRLVTKALVLGDFESAVSLCLSADRFADAILLAVRGGPDLLQRTQKAYFERRTTSLPYLRLFQSIVTNDLADIVQNADLQEWREIFVVLCTFANAEEFSTLAEQLGRRLEYQYTEAKEYGDPDLEKDAYHFKKNATLTYLAAARLERLVSIWADELVEEEKALIADESNEESTFYSAHAHALQTFVEKVTVFRSATNYKDEALESTHSAQEPAEAFKLAALYDRYFEYADFLCTQGMVKEAVKFLKLTPSGYKGSSSGVDLSSERKRLIEATNGGTVSSATAGPSNPANPTTVPARTTAYGQTGYAPSNLGTASQAPYPPYVQQQPNRPYATTGASNYPPVNTQSHALPPGYVQPHNTYGPGPGVQQHAQPVHGAGIVSIPPPPPPRSTTGTPSINPPPPKRDNGGWNDAPALAVQGRTTKTHKPPPISSPFPGAVQSPGISPVPSPFNHPPSAVPPPPPRPGSVNRNAPPPPGQRTLHQAPPPQGPPPPGPYPPQQRPPSRTASQGVAPPQRLMSPPQGPTNFQPPPRQPTPSQYAPPQNRAPVPGQTPPPGFGRLPPGNVPHGQHLGGQPPAPNPYMRATPPPGQPGPYPPPSAGGHGGPQQHQQPLPPPPQSAGPYGPPANMQRTGPPQGGVLGGPPPPGPGLGGQGPPPPPGGPLGAGGPPPGGIARAPSASLSKPQAAAPKYPPGDRSHIPDYAQPAYQIIADNLNRMKQTTPPNQKRLVEDLERRINPLFDALNCETLSRPVVDQLVVLTRAMEARDRPAALSLHVTLLTNGSKTDDIGMWMSGIKQLIMRL